MTSHYIPEKWQIVKKKLRAHCETTFLYNYTQRSGVW